MAARTTRLELRLDPIQAERIRLASQLLHTSVRAFMVDAASEKAEQVLAEHPYTLVPSPSFDGLLASLDEPPAALPTLAKATAMACTKPAFRPR